jgi:hypothetical protein
VVFKIHPVEPIENYEAAREDAGRPVHVIREWNIVTALLASDLMVSVDVSSPCYYARALDIPQLIFRVAGSAVNDAHLPNFSDVPMVSDHDGLRAMLRALATQRSALPGRTASTLDGLASRRIVDELERESAVH